jgi:hypothetical protein
MSLILGMLKAEQARRVRPIRRTTILLRFPLRRFQYVHKVELYVYLINDSLERIWKEAVVAKVLPRYLPGMAEE